MPDVLLSERPTPKVRLLTLNRLDRLNAMTSELCAALHGELEAIAADRASAPPEAITAYLEKRPAQFAD